jgi:hypothetical protein
MAGALGAALLGSVIMVLFVASGRYDIAAMHPHTEPVRTMLKFLQRRSIIFHARNTASPRLADPELVQSVVESLTSLSFRYPSVRSVDPAQGLWDIHLPGDVVREYDRRDTILLDVEAVDRYFQVRFLNRGAEVSCL